jgi:hypothetical protein
MKKLLLLLLIALGLQTQAQVSPCDSISYTITPNTNNTVLQLNGVITGVCPVTFPCVVQGWSWQVCDDALCFSDTGQTAYFQQFNAYDTLKVCLTTIVNYMGATYSCMSQCDTLIYGPNGWMKMGIGNPTGIEELISGQTGGQMYDLLGREIFEVPKGTIYIKNRKKFIR